MYKAPKAFFAHDQRYCGSFNFYMERNCLFSKSVIHHSRYIFVHSTCRGYLDRCGSLGCRWRRKKQCSSCPGRRRRGSLCWKHNCCNPWNSIYIDSWSWRDSWCSWRVFKFRNSSGCKSHGRLKWYRECWCCRWFRLFGHWLCQILRRKRGETAGPAQLEVVAVEVAVVLQQLRLPGAMGEISPGIMAAQEDLARELEEQVEITVLFLRMGIPD